LGFQVNKKFNLSVNYWKFVLACVIASTIAIVIYQIGKTSYQELIGMMAEEPYNSHSILAYFRLITNGILTNLPFIPFVILPESLIIGIFLKKFKKKSPFNDSLDSDIVN
jgi:accessory gene regulator protein AgrB